MKTHLLILASAVLLITSGVASAKTRMLRYYDQYGISRGFTAAPSSTNPRASAPNGLLQAPHEVPENGGAAMFVVPGWSRRARCAQGRSSAPPYFWERELVLGELGRASATRLAAIL